MGERFTSAELETLRRSLSMAPLSSEQIVRLIESNKALLAERAELETLLGDLLPSWQAAREVLNRLHRVISG